MTSTSREMTAARGGAVTMYKPAMAKVLEEHTPEAVTERRRKALELVDRPTPAPPRVSAPSPWAQGAGGELDKAALPSATAPAVEEQAGATEAVAPPAGGVLARHSWRVVAACATVGAMVLLVAVLVEMGKAPPVKADATVAIVMGTSASERVGGPGVMMTGAAPSATATASASTAPSAPSATKARGKPRDASADPYDSVASPSPPVTVAPSVTAAPSSVPSVVEPKPSPSAAATDDDSFMRKRHQ